MPELARLMHIDNLMEMKMQKKTKMFLAAGAAGVLAIGAAASIANADMGGEGGWGMGRGMGYGGMGHGGRGGMGMMMMERYDANKDGKITQDEIDTNRAEWLKEFDADKNGTLSLDEFQNLWLKARHEQIDEFYQARREFFRELLAGTRFRLLPVSGAYFQLVDYSAISDKDDFGFCEWLVANAGVAAIPVSAFYESPPPDMRLIRFCFAKSDDILRTAAQRLSAL